jgi:uncharacterized protein with von Willebrand factor type A (vWA) domain
MLDLLNGFVVELRNAGLPVSLTENLDAMEAVQHIPIEDREAFKYALGATLVKNSSHWRAFETVFEVYFAARTECRSKPTNGGDEWREMQEQRAAWAPGRWTVRPRDRADAHERCSSRPGDDEGIAASP